MKLQLLWPLSRRKFPVLLSFLVFILIPQFIFSQCSNWSITAQLTTTSTCAANGNFAVTVSGPDASNITNLQYGIPVAPNGFSVPFNNSAVFNNIPAGTYQVSALGSCGGNFVGKNTNIYMPGNYSPPTINISEARGSLNCGAYGKIGVTIYAGKPPFVINILSQPSAYTGPLSFTTSSNIYTITALPPGSYTIQVSDVCGNTTNPAIASITSLDLTAIPLFYNNAYNTACNTVSISEPIIQTSGTGWFGYEYDNLFQVSAQIGGNLSAPTAFQVMDGSSVSIQLPPGKTIKDCYGESITYTILPPCGSAIQGTVGIPYPDVYSQADQNCNIDFTAALSFSGMICYPVTYSFHDNVSGASYGPYTTTVQSVTTPALPIGNYTINYTTGDGYTGTAGFGTSQITGNPYSVSVVGGADGLNNYVEGFLFSTNASVQNKTVELFNGPAGYSFLAPWSGTNLFMASQNQTPGPGTIYFPAGNYVWKITDNCGSYLIPITVGSSDLYQFTVGIDSQKQTCQGLRVWPHGTAVTNGQSVPVAFSVLRDGGPMYDANTNWPQYPAGSYFVVDQPGDYTIVPSATSTTFFSYNLNYPNVYTSSYAFNYNVDPLSVDINKSQGFLCIGAGPGQAKLYVSGLGGMPFHAPLHYKYYLAHQGQGASGPYLANNTTGVFTGFGGSANAIFDVKIVDSCGASVVQSLKILDLQTAGLISSSNYIACENSTVELTAIYLPNATYAWTGPNGFTSTLREVTLNNVGPLNAGVYHVAITTTECNQVLHDSTILILSPNPPAPLVTLDCSASPVSLTITNPVPGYSYLWEIGLSYLNSYFSYLDISDTGYTKYPNYGSYKAVALDSTTGCMSKSDSFFFASNPSDTLVASVYSPHLKICTGDTTILVAEGAMAALSYQWFRNGVLIPGATNETYITAAPGNYKVSMVTGPCGMDTSDEVTVTIISPPSASITLADPYICEGDTSVIQANAGTGYTYTWNVNGSTVPDAHSATLPATTQGDYFVTISNGGCVAVSNTVFLTVYQGPVITLTPDLPQYLCGQGVIHFSTVYDASYIYSWKRNGILIPGAHANTYDAVTDGSYQVVVSNPTCPQVSSDPVLVTRLPDFVSLGNDTVICQPGSVTIPLSVDPGFTQILWSNGSTNPQVMAGAGGDWWVQVSNACGVFSDTVHIYTLNDYLPDLPSDTVICNAANSAVLSVPAILQSVSWSNGVNNVSSITVTQPGIYWVQGSSPCGMLYDTVNVGFCAPEIQDVVFSDSVCEGHCTQMIPVVDHYPLEYHWSFPGGQPDSSVAASPGQVCYAHEGVYPVKLMVKNAGGSDSFSTQIVVLPQPVPRFADTFVTVSYKADVLLPACAYSQTADWYQNDSLVCENCQMLSLQARYWQSIYTCVVRNGSCTDTCTYKLMVTDIPSDLWLPDAFTPNGDGRNDHFGIITDNPNIGVTDLSVYDRWGARVHWGSDPKGWDGSYNGAPADGGTYFWVLTYKVTGNGRVFTKKGDVILVR